MQGLAGALVEAWRLYSVPSSVILFIIEDVTYNICDQRFHEFEIRSVTTDILSMIMRKMIFSGGSVLRCLL